MTTASVFVNNKTQAVRLPVETRFPEGTKRVTVRVVGTDRILSPIDKTWDSFFLSDKNVSNDFISERATQQQTERESLDD